MINVTMYHSDTEEREIREVDVVKWNKCANKTKTANSRNREKLLVWINRNTVRWRQCSRGD